MFEDFKTEIKLFIIVLIAAVAISVGGILFLKTLSSQHQLQPTDQQVNVQAQPTQELEEIDTSTSTPLSTSDWQTYRNEEFGFEVKYPTELMGLSKTTPEGVSFWFASDKGVKFANYEFFARQEDSCGISTASSGHVYLAGVQFMKGVHMFSNVVENPDKDGIVGIQYVSEHEGICYQLNYWERIQKGVRYSPYDIDEMDQFITQFDQILSTFRFIE